jgi:uncharacterized membrane protein YsdA (DUF1294 family)
MGNPNQEPDLSLIFKAAKSAHDRGNLVGALSLYKQILDKDPYYPGLDAEVRALEMQMTRSSSAGHQRQRSLPSKQSPTSPSTRRSQPTRPARHPSRHTNPYLLYGIITFLPALILTLILARVVFPNWDLLILWLVIINVITFLVYGYDKLIAPSNMVRVPEFILLLQVVLGAFFGALIARTIFRHKTQKRSFRINFWIAETICIIWVALYLILT